MLSCARKEIVDIDIFLTSRNGVRKIMQSIRIRIRPPLRKRKPRVEKKQQGNDQQSSIFVIAELV